MLVKVLWRLQIGYAEFTNDGSLLAALIRGVCVQSFCTYRGILHMPSFSAVTFLPHATMEAHIAGNDQEE